MRCPNCGHRFHRVTGSIPSRILETLELEGFVSIRELMGPLIDAKPESIRRAYYLLLKSGEVEADRFGDNVHLGRTQ